MRFGWVAVVVVLLAGCGSGDGQEGDDLPDPPTASTTPLPAFDPATKPQAKKLLDSALEQLGSDDTISFRSTVALFGATLTGTGAVDIDDEASSSELRVSGQQLEDLEDLGGEASLEFRVLKTHVYGSPTFGPFDKCWFDYGDSNPLFANDQAPWLHIAVAAVTDAEALGMADGSEDSVVVEVPALELLSVTSSKLANMLADELTDDPIMARAVVEVHDGRYAGLRFNVDEAFLALDDGGVDVIDALETAVKGEDVNVRPSQVRAMLRKYFSTTQTVTYEHGAPVTIEAPPANELMDASDVTDPENPPTRKPKLCAAAG